MHSENHFSTFQLPVDFSVDKKELEQRYRQLQREAHPDRFAHKSSSEQLSASQASADINEAYQTLKHPVKRAQYLIKLAGHELPKEHTINDVEFLMLQMELREKLEHLSEQENLEELQTFSDEVQQILFQLEEKMSQAYTAFKGHGAAEDLLTYINEYQFVDKLLQEIESQEDKLLDY